MAHRQFLIEQLWICGDELLEVRELRPSLRMIANHTRPELRQCLVILSRLAMMRRDKLDRPCDSSRRSIYAQFAVQTPGQTDVISMMEPTPRHHFRQRRVDDLILTHRSSSSSADK